MHPIRVPLNLCCWQPAAILLRSEMSAVRTVPALLRHTCGFLPLLLYSEVLILVWRACFFCLDCLWKAFTAAPVLSSTPRPSETRDTVSVAGGHVRAHLHARGRWRDREPVPLPVDTGRTRCGACAHVPALRMAPRALDHARWCGSLIACMHRFRPRDESARHDRVQIRAGAHAPARLIFGLRALAVH